VVARLLQIGPAAGKRKPRLIQHGDGRHHGLVRRIDDVGPKADGIKTRRNKTLHLRGIGMSPEVFVLDVRLERILGRRDEGHLQVAETEIRSAQSGQRVLERPRRVGAVLQIHIPHEQQGDVARCLADQGLPRPCRHRPSWGGCIDGGGVFRILDDGLRHVVQVTR
jgi:hypothetical protein